MHTYYIFTVLCYFVFQNITNTHQSPINTIGKTKRGVDLSFSYSATQIGSHDGSHFKTVTVVKNVGNHHKHTEEDKKHKEHLKHFSDLVKIPVDLFENLHTFSKESKEIVEEPSIDNENDGQQAAAENNTESSKKNDDTTLKTSEEPQKKSEESETSSGDNTNEKKNIDAVETVSNTESEKPHKEEKLKSLPADDGEFKSSPIGKIEAEISAKAQQLQFAKNKLFKLHNRK